MNEELTVFERPAKVVAVSVNSAGFSDLEFRREVEKLEAQTGYRPSTHAGTAAPADWWTSFGSTSGRQRRRARA